MDNERKELTVPYIAYESALDRLYEEDKTILSERQVQNIVYKAERALFKHL